MDKIFNVNVDKAKKTCVAWSTYSGEKRVAKATAQSGDKFDEKLGIVIALHKLIFGTKLTYTLMEWDKNVKLPPTANDVIGYFERRIDISAMSSRPLGIPLSVEYKDTYIRLGYFGYYIDFSNLSKNYNKIKNMLWANILNYYNLIGYDKVVSQLKSLDRKYQITDINRDKGKHAKNR